MLPLNVQRNLFTFLSKIMCIYFTKHWSNEIGVKTFASESLLKFKQKKTTRHFKRVDFSYKVNGLKQEIMVFTDRLLYSNDKVQTMVHINTQGMRIEILPTHVNRLLYSKVGRQLPLQIPSQFLINYSFLKTLFCFLTQAILSYKFVSNISD